MSKTDLITFFNEASDFTKFERIKKIYELTNNLDIDLLYDLKQEFRWYSSSLELKLKLENDENYELNLPPMKEYELRNFNILKKYIDTFLQHTKKPKENNYSVYEDDINSLIALLVSRKLMDLPKSSRHKNDLNFATNKSDTFYFHEFVGGENYDPPNTDNLVDLSDTSIVGKIIYLEKLGIIDFLRKQNPFSTSINSIATVFSAITGAKPTSIQPLLNPLLGKDVNNKNNPLFSKKNVLTVENLLSKIGFEVSKKK